MDRITNQLHDFSSKEKAKENRSCLGEGKITGQSFEAFELRTVDAVGFILFDTVFK